MSGGALFEASGATVEQATASALAQAGLTQAEALIEILSEGGTQVPGERISGATARVRVSAVPPEALVARRHLVEMLRLMEIEAVVTVVRPQGTGPAESAAGPEGPVMLEIDGNDLGILIGWRGESLRALQTIINLMLGPTALQPGGPRVIVDVAHYRERRERAVAQMARRVAADVVRSGRAQTLDPMPPYERRAVHIALSEDPAVTTESQGVNETRSVTIRPTARQPTSTTALSEAGRS